MLVWTEGISTFKHSGQSVRDAPPILDSTSDLSCLSSTWALLLELLHSFIEFTIYCFYLAVNLRGFGSENSGKSWNFQKDFLSDFVICNLLNKVIVLYDL
jgi:hypothetical protein